MEELEARVAHVECECRSLREALAGALLAIETHGRAALSVTAELVARNVALTGAAPFASNGPTGPTGRPPPPFGSGFCSASAPGTVVVRDDALGVALLGNSATFSMRLELKRYGSWATDAPARWVIPREDYEQNRAEWSTRFGVTFAKE